MSRQPAHARFAERLGEAMTVNLHVRVVEREGRQVIEVELRVEHAPSEATFSMRISREPFGFGHSSTGSLP